MMQGNEPIDELMLPVLHAIKRHVKDRAAITEIYNRAYEALMMSMDVKTGKTYCAYCGAEYPLDDSAATLVGEHIKTCEKHPMRKVEDLLSATELALDASNKHIGQLEREIIDLQEQIERMEGRGGWEDSGV